jgi:hypothetical protein
VRHRGYRGPVAEGVGDSRQPGVWYSPQGIVPARGEKPGGTGWEMPRFPGFLPVGVDPDSGGRRAAQRRSVHALRGSRSQRR